MQFICHSCDWLMEQQELVNESGITEEDDSIYCPNCHTNGSLSIPDEYDDSGD